MKSPPKQDAPQLLPPSRITGIFHCIPVLVQEESALVHRQLIQDPLRVERILALGRLGAHGVIVTRWEGHGPAVACVLKLVLGQRADVGGATALRALPAKCTAKLRTVRATMAMAARAMIPGMVIGLRSGKAVCRSGLAEAVPTAGDPGGGDRLVFAVPGDQQPGGDVESQADAGEQSQRGDDDADERDVRVQVTG